MVQNHLIQLLCLATMEPPIAYDANDIRGKKMDVLHALQNIPRHAVNEYAARGQYGEGCIGGEQTRAYRQEPGVAADSNVETFAALKAHIDNWRWQGVPFYMRTGKRLTLTVSEISIRFLDVPHCAFPSCDGLNAQPARLVIQIQPKEGMFINFMAKEPGFVMRLQPVTMRFTYQEAFGKRVPDAYETLLRDAMMGDPTLFMRSDQVEAAWCFVDPVLENWQQNRAVDFPNYAAGLWAPNRLKR
jgi:glucose-6-phosphate 1-dehydrogenase